MISASIVLFQTSKIDIDTVLSSYMPSTDKKLFIIDNSPKATDYCQAMVNDNISYTWNAKNIGYGSAHNIGIRKAIEIGSRYHVIMNPDIQFNPGILDELADYMDDHEDTVYILPKVIYPDGRIQYLCKLLPTPMDLLFRRFFPSVGIIRRMNDRYILKDFGYNRIINPPCLSGCFMFMRTSTLKEQDLLFDEQFFMYCEDFDLIRRLHRVGKTIFYPYATIVHNYAKESYKSKKMLMHHIRSTCLYFNKYGWIVDKERTEQNRIILDNLG